jgi:hypothetical protein
MSIMYDTVKYIMDEKNGVRRLKELKLYEFGPVDFAANEQALILGVKDLAQSFRRNVNNPDLTEVKKALNYVEQMLYKGQVEPEEPSTKEAQSVDTGLVKGIGSLIDYINEAVRA